MPSDRARSTALKGSDRIKKDQEDDCGSSSSLLLKLHAHPPDPFELSSAMPAAVGFRLFLWLSFAVPFLRPLESTQSARVRARGRA
jgi:hypothetical protein